MKIIKPYYEILAYPKDALGAIERAARICYKSEDKIKEGSAKLFVTSIIRRGHLAMIEFGGDIVVRFVSNRGFTHELVRHRIASFAQESTRYCSYNKDKFDGELTFIGPLSTLGGRDDKDLYNGFRDAWRYAELAYLNLLDDGATAEVAREVLPIGLKAEIVIKANVREWMHILQLRASRKAHPRMRELMVPLKDELRTLVPVVFDGV
jgi:thymidylate synthase (FAD)